MSWYRQARNSAIVTKDESMTVTLELMDKAEQLWKDAESALPCLAPNPDVEGGNCSFLTYSNLKESVGSLRGLFGEVPHA